MRKRRFWLTKTWNWQTKIEGCVKQTKLGNWRAQKKMLSRVEKNGSSKQKGISWSLSGVSGIDFSHQHVRSFKALSRWKPKKVPEAYTRMARDDNQLSTPSVLGFIDVHVHYIYISFVCIFIHTYIYRFHVRLKRVTPVPKNVPIQNEHLWLLLWHMPHGRQDPLP